MELSNECLVNENLTKEIKSQVIGCQSQMGKFDLFFELHFGHRLYSHTDNLSKSFQSGKCLLPLVNDWQTSLKNETIAIYFRAKVTPQASCTWLFHH